MENKANAVLPLTPRQKEALDFLKASIRQYGYAPTHKEISEHFGFDSRNSARLLLQELARKGAIAVIRRAHRGISLVSP